MPSQTMRVTYTRTGTDIIWPWNDTSPYHDDYQSYQNEFEEHDAYLASNYGMTKSDMVTVNDLQVYWDFTFPSRDDFADYIENYYNQPSVYGQYNVPTIPGMTFHTDFEV